MMTRSALPWDTLLTYLSRNAAMCRAILGQEVITMGSGPCEEGKFDNFLRECRVEVYSPLVGGREVLVIGQENWDPQDLDETIEARAGQRLRVYSQEMVLASLAFARDVFDLLDHEDLIAFADGHPALTYLMQDIGFDWPTTDVAESYHRLVIGQSTGRWTEKGVLTQM